MNRNIPFDENTTCDECGEKGAYDFMGDYLCPKCSNKYINQGDRLITPEESLNISVEVLGIDKVAELGNKDAGLCIAIGEIQRITALKQDKHSRAELIQWLEEHLLCTGGYPSGNKRYLQFEIDSKEWAELKTQT